VFAQDKKPEAKEPDLSTQVAEADPDFKIQGEYEGEVAGKGKYAAQVVALGGGKFDVYFLAGGLPGAGWDTKTRTKVGAATADGKVTFTGSGWTGTIGAGTLSGTMSEDTKFTFQRVDRHSPTLDAKPPEDAIVLFDGSNADAWTNGRIVDSNLLYRGTTSKKGFATGKLHVEFRTSYQPKARGQGRGNSGVFILGREIQVLDSFGLNGENNECGAFYGHVKPAVNMCLPPLAWQTYDVEIKPNDKGDLRATVWHNGVKVHEDYPIGKKGAKPAGINLQDHGNPVVYRNIWFTESKPDEKAPDLGAAARKVKQIIGHRGSCSDRPENTLASYRRAIEVGASVGETDVRTTKDGELVCRHDAGLAKTTNGKGLVSEKTLAEIKALDAGSSFDPKYKDERIPTLREVLQLCKGKMHVMLDLKESGQKYAEQITAEVREHGDPKEIVLGIRSVEHARQFRKLLPEARQIGLVPKAEDIEAFAAAGVETIRLWPDWLSDKTLVPRVRKLKCQLHLHAAKGTREEVLSLLPYEPESLSSDDPGRLLRTLAEIKAP
jgi:glycerophosphoryl diester phosphodiesterase